MIRFTVLGIARPQGNKRHVGKGVMIELASLKPWRQAVSYCAREAYRGDLLDGPIALRLRIFVPRPRSHFGQKGLKSSAPRLPHRRAQGDTSKMLRAIEDALTGIVWTDDKRVVSTDVVIVYGEPARAEIEIRDLEQALEAAKTLAFA